CRFTRRSEARLVPGRARARSRARPLIFQSGSDAPDEVIMRAPWSLLLLTVLLSQTAALGGADPVKNKKDSANKDYSAEMPRIPPKTPAESLKCFQLRPGFRIEL